MVVCAGETDVLPATAPPVLKLFPVHDVAFCEDHDSVALCPPVIEVGVVEREHAGPTAQDAKVYEPESVPFEHVRVSEEQLEPYGTVAV